MMKRTFWGLTIVTVAVAGTLLRGQGRPAADPLSDGASNVRLVGYSDLQGRESLYPTSRIPPTAAGSTSAITKAIGTTSPR